MKEYQTQDITPDLLARLKYDDAFSPEEVDAIVALAQTIYPADELQRHLDRDNGVGTLDEVIAEIEEMMRQHDSGAR